MSHSFGQGRGRGKEGETAQTVPGAFWASTLRVVPEQKQASPQQVTDFSPLPSVPIPTTLTSLFPSADTFQNT